MHLARLSTLLLICCLGFTAEDPTADNQAVEGVAVGEAAGADPAAEALALRMPKVTAKTGTVKVGQDLATINLPADTIYLERNDARTIVEQFWGNPPDSNIIGLIAPSVEALADEESWAIILSYDASDGHVKDDDAKGIDYADLLTQMKEGTNAANTERKKAGYPTVELLGWAEPPHYDSVAQKLYWAKSLRFQGTSQPQLNYCIRVLTRAGVLEMNAIAAQAQLATISVVARDVLAKTELNSGNRYEDFKPGIDKVAAYGIGGLIAGGILAKSGFFAVIGKFLLVMLKPLIFIVVAAAIGFGKFFAGRKQAGQSRQAGLSKGGVDPGQRG